jgi:hypothetical protein
VEVAALEEVAIADLLSLFSGQRYRAPVRVLRPGGELEDGWIEREDFVPTLDSYFYRVSTLVDQALRGYPHLVL